MENKTTIDKPIQEYNHIYKDLIKKNSTDYFDNLAKKVKVSANENKTLVKNYDSANTDYKLKQKKANNSKGLKIFLIVLSVISAIAGIILTSIFFSNKSKIGFIIAGILLILLSIVLVIVIVAKLNNVVKHNQQVASKAKEVMEEKLKLCYNQMYPLNSALDYQIPDELFKKTLPIIELDSCFKLDKLTYLIEKFNFPISNFSNKNSSILVSKSGSIQGNPFVILRTLNQEMYNHVYSGSTVYSYTTTYTDSEGHTRTTTHTETLTATVVQPASRYYESEVLIYANPGAEKLEFSRKPTLKDQNMSEKQLEKFINKKTKENLKRESKELTDGNPDTNYTSMTNNEFEALFDATNRNDEMQFRMMFTPLAQQNMVSLIKDSIYGDDFTFIKDKMINYIYCEHSQAFDSNFNPIMLYSHDYQIVKNSFVNYMVNYFNNLYFELAPILSIPLYQQTKPFEYIYKKTYEFNASPYDQERFSNYLDQSELKDSRADTLGINKTSYVESVDGFDIVDVINYAFIKVPQVTYVPVTASDGHVVDVPVSWFRYDPVSKKSTCAFLTKNGTSNELKTSLRDAFNNSNISFAKNNSVFYNNSVAGFVFNKVLQRASDYPQVEKTINEFTSRYLNNPNNNQNVNINKSENKN